MFILGIDIGTQSLKAVVLGEGLTPLGSGAAAYQPQFPQPLWAEQDPRLWLDALVPPSARPSPRPASPRRKSGHSASAASSTAACRRPQGEAMGPCLIWMDRRARRRSRMCRPRPSWPRAASCSTPSHMAAKIRWLKRHHGEARDIARFHQPISYLVERLTGRAVMDHALASTTMVYDLDRRLDPALAGSSRSSRASCRIAARGRAPGGFSAAGAALTGLQPGIPVAVGTGDDFSTPLGAGLRAPRPADRLLGHRRGGRRACMRRRSSTRARSSKPTPIPAAPLHREPRLAVGRRARLALATLRLTGVDELTSWPAKPRRAPTASPSCRRSPVPWRRNGSPRRAAASTA